ncbi:fungal-specific transcription factor domain-containing protein [Xylaria telfairii]|nr:fungal-specific transcription factor domain-containing protein [Xylaria telfairii]
MRSQPSMQELSKASPRQLRLCVKYEQKRFAWANAPRPPRLHISSYTEAGDFRCLGCEGDNRERPRARRSGAVEQSGLAAVPALASHEIETRLIDTTNWEAVLREIEIIKSSINDLGVPESLNTNAPLRPSLLFGFTDHVSIEHLVNALPAKRVTDRLVNIFTRASHFPILPIHLPTFLRDYKAFWENPSEVDLPWLSILFSIITIALQFVLESGTDFEEIPFPESASQQYASKAAECLRRSDYAKPISKTVEAMLMCLLCEHTWLNEYHFRASLVLSFAIRIAMRSGYHRDPSHFSEISVFDGEMRRRTWSYLVQLDMIFASYLGLPPHINDHQNDTRLPENVPDEDLYPEMKDLPPSRPANEPSTTGFLNYRAQTAVMLGQITEYTVSFQELTYEKILDLDRALKNQISTCPSWLKAPTSSDQSVHGPINVNRAIEVDILQQRAYITLHRRFLVPARTNTRYLYSRDACLAAAARVLRHQQTLSKLSFEIDGMVVQNWRVLSLMSHDFLLSAMVLCVGIEHALQDGLVFEVRPTYGIEDIREHLELLESCQRLLIGGKGLNPATHKAVQAIRAVISQAYKALGLNRGEEEFTQATTNGQWLSSMPAAPQTSLGTSLHADISQASNAFRGMSNAFFPPIGAYLRSSPNSGTRPEMADGISTIFDWNTWES